MKPLVVIALLGSAAHADELWWSFPGDDPSAIEIDDADLRAGDYETRAAFMAVVRKCDLKKGKRLLRDRERGAGIPLREIRVLTPDDRASPPALKETRCVMPLATWRRRFGARLVDRLEDELDAHVSFLHPRKTPNTHPPDGTLKP